MINWIVFIFIIAGYFAVEMFDLTSMLMINLSIIAVSRVVFVLGYYFKYIKTQERHSEKEKYVFSKKEKLYFLGKNAAVIIIGFLHIYLALFLAVYSLMCATIYFKEKFEKLSRYSYYLIPIGFILAFLVVFADIIAIIPISLAIGMFLYRGQKYANYSLEELFERYHNRIMQKIPSYLQYVIIFILIVPPLLFFIALQIWGLCIFEGLNLYLVFIFNILNMFTVNLTIILAARRLHYIAIKEEYLEEPKSEESQQENFNVYLKSRKKKLLIANIFIILFSFLIIYIAIFFVIYSVLISGIIFNRLKKQKNENKYNLHLFASYALIPISLGLAIFFYFDMLAFVQIVIAGALAGLLYIVKGQKHASYSLKEIFESFNRRFGEKVPNILKYFLLVYIIVVPLFLVVGMFVVFYPHKETYMVEMDDGTELATDVYYSPMAWDFITGKPKPAPVILIRTPYGKDGFSGILSMLYTSQGYHVVVQDFRGCYDSEGDDDFLLFTMDYTDGPDTIDWILDKEWCNGLIGSSGISALCITQYMFAPTAQDELKCQGLWFGTPDLIRDAILEGAFHEGLIYYWIKGVAPDNWRKQLNIIYDCLNDTTKLNEEYARAVTLERYPNQYGNVSVHGLHIGGWYDHFLKGTIRGYVGYDDHGGKEARGHQKLIIGPWIHGMVYMTEQGELTYPDSANGLPLILKWEQEIFDESLLGVKNDELWDGNRVAYYLMGDVDDPNADANYWKYAKDWPLKFNENEWYLGLDEDGDYVVVDRSGDLDGYNNLSYLYDPIDPISTRGGNNEPGFTSKGAGPFDQRPVEVKVDEDWEDEDADLRDDLLLFQSKKFDKPYTVEGDLKARLCVKSDQIDTDFMIKVSDVYPDGRRMLIIDSALTMRCWNMSVNGFWDIGSDISAELTFIEPGKEYEILINLAGIAYQFNKGHRIAVTIQSSNYDRFSINANTGGPITDHYSSGNIANNTIITGPGKSCIILPELD